jgi:hypothetical protein
MDAKTDTSELFEAWWDLYPRKVGKGAARACYYRALRMVEPAALLAALQAQLDAGVFRVEPMYIPHPKTWLAQERWADELTTKRAGGLAEGIAERYRDASRRGDDRAKLACKEEAKRRNVDWELVRAAVVALNGGAS